jgi:hypothetical protein
MFADRDYILVGIKIPEVQQKRAVRYKLHREWLCTVCHQIQPAWRTAVLETVEIDGVIYTEVWCGGGSGCDLWR